MIKLPTTIEEVKDYRKKFENELKDMSLAEIQDILTEIDFEAENSQMSLIRDINKCQETDSETRERLQLKAAYFSLLILLIEAEIMSRFKGPTDA